MIIEATLEEAYDPVRQLRAFSPNGGVNKIFERFEETALRLSRVNYTFCVLTDSFLRDIFRNLTKNEQGTTQGYVWRLNGTSSPRKHGAVRIEMVLRGRRKSDLYKTVTKIEKRRLLAAEKALTTEACP